MDKPQTLSMKDWLIRNLSVEKRISESIIGAVINHEFNVARDKMATCNSIEFSGFGKISFRKKAFMRKMDKLLGMKESYEKALSNPNITEEKRRYTIYKIKGIDEDLEYLKPKIDNIYEDQFKSDMGGVGESSISS